MRRLDLRTLTLGLLAIPLTGCPADTNDNAVRACYELADLSCTHHEDCGEEDKYACMASYIEALPCHEALEIADEDRLEQCFADQAERPCGDPTPSSCREIIGY